MTSRHHALLLGWLAGVSPAAAQVADSTRPPVFRVGEISVQAARPVTTAGGASALEVQLDSLHLAPAPTMEQVLRQLPLVQVRTNSRGEAQFSLRGSGSDARQVAVLVDGVPLSLGWDDRADLSVLPATAAGTLTLIRGLPSMLHGPNVLGGVIEVGVGHHPGRWLPPRSTELSAGVESTGAFSLSTSHTEPIGAGEAKLALRVGAGYRERPGFALPGNVSQPVSEAVEYDPDLRTNTDLQHEDGFVALRFLASDGMWATLSSSAFAASRGIAPELHAESPRYWRYPRARRWVSVVSGGTGDRITPFGRGDLEASIGYDVGNVDILSYTSSSFREVGDSEEGDDRTVTVRLLGDHTLGGSADLRAAFTYADILHDELLSGRQANTYQQRMWSLGAETVARVPVSGRFPHLNVSVSGALDGADTPQSGDKSALGRLHDWGARVGATLVSAGGSFLLHAGASRRARFPALRELYSGALGRFEPNPTLRPEVLTAAEAGATTRVGDGEVQLVAFYRDLDGAIERVTLPDRRLQRVNVGGVRSTGVELLGSARVGHVTLSGDLTLQRVRLHDDAGERQAGHPEYQPSVMAGARAELLLPLDLRAAAAIDHVGRQYCVDPNAPGELELRASERFDVDVVRDVQVRRSGFGSRLELSAVLENATDAAIYDQCGLPQPGRTARIQLRLR
jgi:iron complex outermembrane receptor protein